MSEPMTESPISDEPVNPVPVIHLRGTWEPLGNIGCPSTVFLDALPRPKFGPILVPYPADYGRPIPFADSNTVGRAEALALIRSLPGEFVLSGYSAGAGIAGDLARDIGAGKVEGVDPSRLAACALLADPRRPEGADAPGIPAPAGYGIAGQRYILGATVLWGSAPHDPITGLPADNPLRSVADLTTYWSSDPSGWRRWGEEMLRTVVERQMRMQAWWRIWGHPQRWAGAVDALDGYLRRGAHTDDYLRFGIAARLAGALDETMPDV